MKYIVSRIVEGYIPCEVEASSEEEAQEIVENMDFDLSNFQQTNTYVQVEGTKESFS